VEYSSQYTGQIKAPFGGKLLDTLSSKSFTPRRGRAAD
jgi:hypothetical protein